jgi:hypothetical protein
MREQVMAKLRTLEFWQGQLEAWRRSGLTQVAYCASHGLSIKSFYRWRRKEAEPVASAAPSLTLVPISIAAPAPNSVARLHSPGGWRIELPTGNPSWLVDLLRQLP